MEGGKWKDLSTDVLVDIFLIELGWSHLLDVPFVCKSCYKKISTALVKFVANRSCGNAPLSSPRKNWIMLQTSKASLLLHYYYEKENSSF